MGHITRLNEPPPLPVSARPMDDVELSIAGPGQPHVYVLREALAAIKDHIGWGRSTGANGVEQGGLLIGHVFRDANTDESFAVVKRILEARSAESTSVSIEMNHATWLDLLNRFDGLALAEHRSPWRIVGWYHTHPNSLPVFMSGTDRRTQRDFFAGPEFFALVFNPHQRLWKAFQGAECLECPAVAFGQVQPEAEGQKSPLGDIIDPVRGLAAPERPGDVSAE